MTEEKPSRLSGQQARVITGLILAALVVLLVLFAPIWSIITAISLLSGLAMAEYLPIGMKKAGPADFVFGVICALGAPLSLLLNPSLPAAVLGLGLVLSLLAVMAVRGDREQGMEAMFRFGFGLLYVGGLFTCLAIAVSGSGGRLFLLFMVACVAICDAGAYYTGSLLGKHKMAPAISPAKTWEGLAGGLLAGAITGAVFAFFWLEAVTPMIGALAGLILGGAGAMGDLVESMLKRSAGVKDSGRLLPGHGGILDRLDAHLMAVPVLLLLRELPWL